MIRYALSCNGGHEFEGWFGSSADFDDQAARGLLECPMCASRAVTKGIMAPRVSGTKAQGGADKQAMMLQALRTHVEENFDDVGDAFAAEARAIHEGKAEQREIYGNATGQEVADLIRDGVPVAPLPPAAPAKKDIH